MPRASSRPPRRDRRRRPAAALPACRRGPRSTRARGHPRLDVVIGGLESEHEQRVRPVARAGHRGLARIDQAAVGRVQARLRQRAHRVARRLVKSSNSTAAEARWVGRGRTRIHASVITPSVPSEPISIRSGETPAPEPGSRRDSQAPHGRQRPHRLDEVVDVRVERREVAAGAGGDPAAERRELKRLREVAQGQPVLGRAAPRARARWRRPGSAPTATPGRPRGRGRAP